MTNSSTQMLWLMSKQYSVKFNLYPLSTSYVKFTPNFPQYTGVAKTVLILNRKRETQGVNLNNLMISVIYFPDSFNENFSPTRLATTRRKRKYKKVPMDFVDGSRSPPIEILNLTAEVRIIAAPKSSIFLAWLIRHAC